MRGKRRVLFLLFGAVLVYGVLFTGVPVGQAAIEERRHRDVFLLAVGLLGIAGLLAGWRPAARKAEDRWLLAAAAGLPSYTLLQFIPLPAALVAFISPARAELLRALEPVTGRASFASLSIVPAATFTHFLLLSSYCIIFFAAREFALRMRHVWVVTIPVVAAAAVEAGIGLAQFFAPVPSADASVAATGTYVIHEHFAGLLEMALPLAAIYSMSLFRDISRRDAEGGSDVLKACVGSAVAGLLLAGAFFSLSRGGYVSILVSALVMVSFTVARSVSWKKRLGVTILLFAGGATALFFFTPIEMLGRLSEHTSAGRTSIWRDVPGVIAEYPIFGCGLGGFEFAFLKFKNTMPTLIVDYAHNDYLQYLAELGIAGFAIGATLIGLVTARVARVAAGATHERWIGLAVLLSLAAILTHSAFDFNLYVPANAAVMAWICGLGASLGLDTSVVGYGRRDSRASSIHTVPVS